MLSVKLQVDPDAVELLIVMSVSRFESKRHAVIK